MGHADDHLCQSVCRFVSDQVLSSVQPLDKAALCRFVSDQVLSSVQALGKAAVAAYVQKVLSGKPSGALLGDQALLPKFDAVARRLGNSSSRGRLPPGGAAQV